MDLQLAIVLAASGSGRVGTVFFHVDFTLLSLSILFPSILLAEYCVIVTATTFVRISDVTEFTYLRIILTVHRQRLGFSGVSRVGVRIRVIVLGLRLVLVSVV